MNNLLLQTITQHFAVVPVQRLKEIAQLEGLSVSCAEQVDCPPEGEDREYVCFGPRIRRERLSHCLHGWSILIELALLMVNYSCTFILTQSTEIAQRGIDTLPGHIDSSMGVLGSEQFRDSMLATRAVPQSHCTGSHKQLRLNSIRAESAVQVQWPDTHTVTQLIASSEGRNIVTSHLIQTLVLEVSYVFRK